MKTRASRYAHIFNIFRAYDPKCTSDETANHACRHKEKKKSNKKGQVRRHKKFPYAHGIHICLVCRTLKDYTFTTDTYITDLLQYLKRNTFSNVPYDYPQRKNLYLSIESNEVLNLLVMFLDCHEINKVTLCVYETF